MGNNIDFTRRWGGKTLIERFWENVDIKGDDECWEWIGYSGGLDYGQIQFNKVNYYAHRLAYIIAYGEIPEGLYICHTCDNPPCVNKKHLFAGTCTDNARDMIKKGRKVCGDKKGIKNGRAKLNEEQVRQIREMSNIKKNSEIARIFNVNDCLIGAVVNRQTWKHI